MDIITERGEKVEWVEATTEAHPTRSYAYCSDTGYMPELAAILKDCDLLYHEATFADDLLKKAKKTFHSTARQAGMIAKQAGVKKLLIGHFSSRYKDLDPLLEQAREEFQNTELAAEGIVFNIS